MTHVQQDEGGFFDFNDAEKRGGTLRVKTELTVEHK